MNSAVFAVPLLASAVLVAQTPPPEVIVPLPLRGMMPAFDAGMMFSNDPATIVRKGAGLPVQPSTFAGTGTVHVPEFTLNRVLAKLQQQAVDPSVLTALEVDAISTGNDLLPLVYDPASQTYRISSGSVDGWAALLLTLEPESGVPLYQGAPPSIDGATVFGYYFANPTFPDQLQSSIYHELIRSDFQNGSPSLPSGANIDSLDIAMGLILANRGAIDPGVITSVDRLYFSVTHGCARLIELAQAVQNPNQVPFDGATIFEVVFDVPNRTVLDVRLCDQQLGLDNVEIDALGMAMVRNASTTSLGEVPLQLGTTMFVVSAEAGQLAEELMVAAWPQGVTTQDPVVGRLRTDRGTRLVGGGGLLDGKVKSLCTKDPEVSYGASAFGVPTAFPTLGALVPNPMNLSVMASWTQSDPVWDDCTLDGVVTGWAQPVDAVPLLALGMGDPQNGMQPYWFYWPLPVCPAGTASYSFELPLHLSWLTGIAANQYDVFVAMVPLSGSGPIEATYTTLFRRLYVP